MLEKGATYGTQDTQIWAPYYTLHKILAGLLDSYEVAGNKKALEIAQGHGRVGARAARGAAAGDAHQHVEPLHRRRVRRHERSHGAPVPAHRRQAVPRGAPSCSTTSTSSTATPRASTAWPRTWTRSAASTPTSTSRRSPARSRPSATRKELPYYLIAANFWEIVNRSYMYSIGGVAGARTPNNAECFTAQPDTLWENGFANGGQNETCATYNLLKLDRQLFMYDQTAKYMDHYERALYNHILASVAEDDPGNTYHVPLNPGAQKRFGNAQHERLHLLQRHGAREQHEAAGLDLLPQRRQQGALRQPLRPLDAELARAQGGRAADDGFPLCRHDAARREGERPVRHQGPRAALGDRAASS